MDDDKNPPAVVGQKSSNQVIIARDPPRLVRIVGDRGRPAKSEATEKVRPEDLA